MFTEEAAIQFKYDQAIKQAEALEQVASDLRSLSTDKMVTVASGIAENWTGENSKQYLLKYEKVRSGVKDTASDVDDVAKTIRQIAENTRAAELRALAIARLRAYQDTVI